MPDEKSENLSRRCAFLVLAGERVGFMANCSGWASTYRKQRYRSTWFVAANHLPKPGGYFSITTSSNWF